MSLAVARCDGVTVLTLTSDPSSACPPLCQLLEALCCRGCSVFRRLSPQLGGPHAVLGALWIIIGLLHIGLGIILITTRGEVVYSLRETYCPVWLGVLSLLFGVSCVLTERYPRPVLILLNGLLNLIGAVLSIATIVWYSTDVGHPRFDYDYYDCPDIPPFSDRSALIERCEEVRGVLWVLTTSILTVLITLSVLDLCLGISSATLSFKALKEGLSKNRNKPLLKEDKTTPE